MTTQEWLMLIGAIVLLLVAIAAVIFSVKSRKQVAKALSAGLPELSEENVSVKELLTEEKEEKAFIVIFENAEGKEIRISVGEEIFGDFKIGEKGLLTLSDGELLSFIIDEE